MPPQGPFSGNPIVFQVSFGLNVAYQAEELKQQLSSYVKLKTSQWRNTERNLYAAVRDVLRTKRDEILDVLNDKQTFLVQDEHTLEWMKGEGRRTFSQPGGGLRGKRNRLPRKKYAPRVGDSEPLIHPYARAHPWFDLLGHSGGPEGAFSSATFHIQYSGRSGKTGGGPSLFENLQKIDDDGNMFYAIRLSNYEALYYWTFLQYGTSTMVPRGSLKERLGSVYNQEVMDAVEARLRKFKISSKAQYRKNK